MDEVGALGGAWSWRRARQHKTKRQTRSRLSIHDDPVAIELIIDYLTTIVTARVIAPAGVKRVSRRGKGIMTISGTSIAKVTICILLGCCVTMRVTGSAIPMWEFLSRNEKVSTKGAYPSVQFFCQVCQ